MAASSHEDLVVYHRVPANMQGHMLHPLSAMSAAGIADSLLAAAKQKYSWRAEVMDGVIPLLDCRWNDG